MLTEINRNPSRRDLWVFGLLLPVFFGIFGSLRWHSGALFGAETLWGIGGGLFAMFLLVPPFRRWLYVGWMYATLPISWAVSLLTLCILFFVAATPVALLLRLTGRDPMERRYDKAARSYWVRRTPVRDKRRYFRQF